MSKVFVSALAAASIVGFASLAAAQTDPAPAPAPPPAEPPPAAAATPPSEPPPAPAPPPPDASASFAWGTSTPPPADTTKPEEKGPPPLRWRGTTFSWNQSATTTAVGVGRDNYGSEDDFYGWAFSFAPRFYLIDAPKDKLTLSANIGWDVELTDGSTVQRRETLFADLPVRLGYSRPLTKSSDGEYATNLSANGSLTFPTSRASQAQGRYLTTRLGLGLSQTVKVLGNDAKGLNNVTVGVTGSWGHLFARSYQPTNDELEYKRQDSTGNTLPSDDRIGRNSFSMNTLSVTGSVDLPLYGDLGLSTSAGIAAGFKHDFASSECDVQIATGCVTAARDETRTLYQPNTIFDVSLTYPIFRVVDLALGYSNESGWIGEDGERRNIFYSPGAQFYMNVTLNLDVVYSKATGRDKKKASASAATDFSSMY
jgi:hypothetical protein